jgi:hypothetical protein
VTNYISTWMYVENEVDGGIYPQVGGSSTTRETQAIYWRCVHCFFSFARRFISKDSSTKLVLFTNAATLPTVGIVDLEFELASLGVEVYCVPYTWRPDTQRKQWFNQFYLFDILECFENIMEEGDSCIVIDSDALIVDNFDPVIETLHKSGVLLIDVDVGVDEEVSGLTRQQASVVAHRLTGAKISEPQPYFGGEFYGLDTQTLRKTMALARSAFPKNNELARRGQPYFSDEAHFFSFLMSQLGHRRDNANQHARRIWTSQRLNTTKKSDLALQLWHVPSEKLYGLEQIFTDLASGAVDLASLGNAEIKHYAARRVGVGGFYPTKYMGHVLRALGRKAQTLKRKAAQLSAGHRPQAMGWSSRPPKHHAP